MAARALAGVSYQLRWTADQLTAFAESRRPAPALVPARRPMLACSTQS